MVLKNPQSCQKAEVHRAGHARRSVPNYCRTLSSYLDDGHAVNGLAIFSYVSWNLLAGNWVRMIEVPLRGGGSAHDLYGCLGCPGSILLVIGCHCLNLGIDTAGFSH